MPGSNLSRLTVFLPCLQLQASVGGDRCAVVVGTSNFVICGAPCFVAVAEGKAGAGVDHRQEIKGGKYVCKLCGSGFTCVRKLCTHDPARCSKVKALGEEAVNCRWMEMRCTCLDSFDLSAGSMVGDLPHTQRRLLQSYLACPLPPLPDVAQVVDEIVGWHPSSVRVKSCLGRWRRPRFSPPR